MDWIKKNSDKFFLAVSAVVLIGVAVMLFLSAGAFAEKFAEVMTAPPKSDKIPEVDTVRIAEAKKSFDNPVQWTSGVHDGLLFTSERYALREGKLYKVASGAIQHSRTGQSIENKWLIQYALSPTDKNVGLQDPDGDGFLTEDEAIAQPPTDPTKKESHPPYHVLVFVKDWITSPFRWQFMTYTGDPKQPQTLTFQINPMDLRGGGTEFLPIGQEIPKTGFTIKSFQFKEVENKSTGGMDDISEVTLTNTANEELILPLRKIVLSPSQTGILEYRLHKKPGEAGEMLRVPRLSDFVLKPEINVRYKLLDGNQQKAVIQLPGGQKYEVPRLASPTTAPAATAPPTNPPPIPPPPPK